MLSSLTNLHTFRQVAERGSIANAARALHFTASAVSQRLTSLERELGVELVERLGNSLELTEAGQRLLARLPAVFEAAERAEAAVVDQSEKPAQLVLGGFPSGVTALMGEAFRSLEGGTPAVALRICAIEDVRGEQSLRTGDLDILLTQRYDNVEFVRNDGFCYTELARERLYLVAHERHNQAGLKAHARSPWLIPGNETVCGAAFRRLCRGAGFEPDIVADVDDFHCQQVLAAAGFGVCIIPHSALLNRERLAVNRRPIPRRHRRIFAVTRSSTPMRGALRRVIEVLKSCAESACAD